jgi:hypothetical protein
MDSIDLPRRQFLGQSGALVTTAAVLNSPLLAQALAVQPGEEIIPWSDQPSADPGVARGVIQNLQRWEDLDWLTPNSKFFNMRTIIVHTSTSRTGRWRSPASSENRAGFA